MSTLATLAKLRTMSAAELWSRVSGRALVAWERGEAGKPPASIGRYLADLDRFGPDPARLDSELLRQRREHAPRLFASLQSVDATVAAFRHQFPEEIQPSLERADEICRGRITFFGRTFTFGGEIDWHADPSTGRRWPQEYRADIPLAAGNLGFGDVKDVWELNRHQFLVDLAKAWALTGEARYAEAAYRIVDGWIAANPYGIGINWTGPLEVAYRSLSWLWAYYLCLSDPGLTPAFHTRWMASFREHGRFLYRHLELFSSPYNHLVGEATVLFLLGHAWPELREAGAWTRRGRHVLESRLASQFYADGGSVEQATLYHHATLGFYLLAMLAAERCGGRLAGVREQIERSIEFAIFMAEPDGSMPMIGDTDDARPIRFGGRPLWDFRHFQAAGAVMFGRGDFKHCSGGWAEDAFWLLGPDAYEAFNAIVVAPPAERFALLRSSGHAALRSSWSAGADYVCFDCGEQAGGLRTDNVPSAAHGHADALSVVVCLAGRPVLVDPGFFTYNGDRSWERFFRETAAHNTIRIDGRDQATHLEKMAWIEVARVAIEHWEARTDGAVVVASHDGYARSKAPARHRRTVVMTERGYVIIRDELTGSGSHRAEVVFQCAPGRAELAADRLTLDDRFDVAWSSSSPLDARLTCGGPEPASGWIAPGLSQRLAAPRLVLAGDWRETALTLLSIVADRDRVKVERDGVLRFVLRGQGFDDVVDASTLPGGVGRG